LTEEQRSVIVRLWDYDNGYEAEGMRFDATDVVVGAGIAEVAVFLGGEVGHFYVTPVAELEDGVVIKEVSQRRDPNTARNP